MTKACVSLTFSGNTGLTAQTPAKYDLVHGLYII